MTEYHLKFTPEALQDIIEAANYYEDCKKGLGKRFRNEIKRKLIWIKEAPFVYAVRYKNVRFILTETFPYTIHFTIQENRQIIEVHAVLSQFRNPDKFWKDYD